MILGKTLLEFVLGQVMMWPAGENKALDKDVKALLKCIQEHLDYWEAWPEDFLTCDEDADVLSGSELSDQIKALLKKYPG